MRGAVAPGAVRLGLAPVNWNNDDVPEWGVTLPYPAFVATAAQLGYEGVEAGTGAPEDPAALRALLAGHDLALAGAYRWVTFTDPARVEGELAGAVGYAERLAAAGGAVLLVAEHWTERRRALAGRAAEAPEAGLDRAAVELLCRTLNRLGQSLRTLGVQLAFHPHVGTPVETPTEVATVMAGTDPAAVGLCLDTGHTLWGGGDPVETARRYGPRIVYVHAKDVDPQALAEARAAHLGLLDGIRRGVFAPLGGTSGGAVDIEGVATALRQAGFAGWVIMECDRSPRAGNPEAEAAQALPRLRRAFGA